MPPSSIDRSARKLEDLASDGGQAVDTLAGAILRLFIRANEIEGLLAKIGRRVARVEAAVAEPA
jgi:hypothetical protein